MVPTGIWFYVDHRAKKEASMQTKEEDAIGCRRPAHDCAHRPVGRKGQSMIPVMPLDYFRA